MDECNLVCTIEGGIFHKKSGFIRIPMTNTVNQVLLSRQHLLKLALILKLRTHERVASILPMCFAPFCSSAFKTMYC